MSTTRAHDAVGAAMSLTSNTSKPEMFPSEGRQIMTSAAMTSAAIENFFVCVGAQKAGTTWLMRILAHHPDLFITPVKEIHYFDHTRGITQHLSGRKRRSRLRKHVQRFLTQPHNAARMCRQWPWWRDYMRRRLDDNWYRSLFAHRHVCRFAGEATPEYAIIGEEGFRHMRRLAPQARVLFILRNPVDRAWSQTLHHCRANRLDAARQPVEDLCKLAVSERFSQIGDYIATLDAIETVFARDQLSIMFYEDIHADRMAALEQICHFIGLDFSGHDFPSLEQRYNRSQNAVLPQDLRTVLQARYHPCVEELAGRLGGVPLSWQREFGL